MWGGLTVQAILLGLGTLLLAVAGMVFTAMNWSRMDATAQGGVLTALTVALAATTGLAGRKDLPATAESLGLVTVVLALVDAHAVRISLWPDTALAPYWAAGLAVVAALAWWLAAATGIRSSALVAVVMAQAPLFLVLEAVDVETTLAGLALLAQVALVLLLTAPRIGVGRGLPSSTRGFALVPAAWTWTVVTGATITWLLVDGARSTPGSVAVVAAAAAVAVLCSVFWAHEEGMRTLALLGATLLGVASSGWAIRLLVDEAMSLALLGWVMAAVAAVGLRVAPRWGSTPAAVASWAAALVACALLAPIERVLERLATVVGDGWGLHAADRAMAAVSPADVAYLQPWVVVVHLLGVAALLLAWRPKMSHRHASVAAVGVWLSAVVLAPVVLPLSIGGAAALAWISAAAAILGVEGGLRSGGLEEPRAQRLVTFGAATVAAFLALGAGWSVAASATSLLSGALVIVAATWALARGWWVQSLVLARIATGVAVAATAVEAAMVAATLGTTPATGWAIAGAVALASATLALLVLPSRLSGAGEVTAWSIHALSVLAVLSIADVAARGGVAGPGDLGLDAAWRIALLSGAIAAAARAPRGPTLTFASLAAMEALVLWWLELATVGVRAPEPYTLPVAVVFAAGGLLVEHRVRSERDRPGSWVIWGPSLLVAAVPTVWLSLVEPGGLRPLVALVVAMSVLTAGAFTGRRAWVDVGAATVVVLGLARLLPILAAAPNWLTIGLTGAALVAVGATFEQRRRDVRGVRDRYSALR